MKKQAENSKIAIKVPCKHLFDNTTITQLMCFSLLVKGRTVQFDLYRGNRWLGSDEEESVHFSFFLVLSKFQSFTALHCPYTLAVIGNPGQNNPLT